jgi:hypothetical protein
VRRGRTFGPELPPSGLVPPLPFLPAATVCSTWHFSGFLHPETDPGVRQVAGLRSLPARPGAMVANRSCRPSAPRCRRPRKDSDSDVAGPVGAGPSEDEQGPSIPARRAGVFLQPFPLALHPSKLSPRVQQVCVNRLPCPRASRPAHSRNSSEPAVWHVGRPRGAGHHRTCLPVVGPGQRGRRAPQAKRRCAGSDSPTSRP